MSIEEIAKFHLSLSYGDKDRCISELKEVIEKYRYCENSDSVRVKKRIEKYETLINYIENDTN